MKKLLLLVCLSATLACSAGDEPTLDQLLSAIPEHVVGPRKTGGVVAPHNHTPWELSITGSGTGFDARFTAVLTLAPDEDGQSYLDNVGLFFEHHGVYYPTPAFVQGIDPNPIQGGTWVFAYDRGVATWTWVPDEPVASALPATLATSAGLSRSITRAIQGKNLRKALPLLRRQQALLAGAQAMAAATDSAP